ncbi:MAG: hypothetical protein SGPRY_014070, partial [Prymnesium sp.]
MPKLVSPHRTLHIVHTPAELAALVKQLGLDSKLHDNLKQLCGWSPCGRHGERAGRDEAANWQLLHAVRWPQHADEEILLPVVGKISWIKESIVELSDMKHDTLKKLLNGGLHRMG